MVTHIILFRPKAELSDDQKLDLLEGLQATVRAIPSIRQARIGPRVTHGRPGYEQKMRADLPFAAVLEFDDMEGLQAFLDHSSHVHQAARFMGALEEAFIYDYVLDEMKEV